MHDSTFEALQSRATLVTASRRLARRLQADFNRRMRRAGRSAWPGADILPWPAWIARFWNETFGLALADPALPPRVLLSASQERRLWETIVNESAWSHVLLQVPATARTAQEAWQLVHEWRLSLPTEAGAPNEDTRAFIAWADRFARECERRGWQDAARVPDLLADAFERRRLAPPARLLLAGFDELTPQQQRLLDSLERAGTQVESIVIPANAGNARRLACQEAREEIVFAARWARGILEAQPDASIGIVVPDLQAQAGTIARAFDAMFVPAATLPGAGPIVRPYNISLGRALKDYPLAHSALLVLQLALDELTHTQAGSLLRSPFLGSAEQEISCRAALDAELRRLGETTTTLALLLRRAEAQDADGTPRAFAAARLAQHLKTLRVACDALPRRQLPSNWAEAFSRLLQAMGWPGERLLTSAEFQTFEAWRTLTTELSGLDAIAGRIDGLEALAMLRRLATERIFQPETPAVPIQILGVLETAGLAFDHLWVMGLHDGVWPASPRPNPLLPIVAARRHGLPHASAERELVFARRLTDRLLASAPEVIASYPRRRGDEDLRPSPLIAGLPEISPDAIAVSPATGFRDLIHVARALETLADNRAPALPEGTLVQRGTAVFRDQAACPFRAFARVRLGAASLDEPGPGLDDSTRGRLLHGVLARVWRELKTHAALCARAPEALQALVRAQVAAQIAHEARFRQGTFTARFTGIEQRRLEALVLDWLAIEKARAPFTVAATESPEEIGIGGLRIRAVVDRVDTLSDGARAVIDYKTGRPKTSQWSGARPDEPQLPLYSVAHAPVSAVLFARLRRGEMGFAGVVRGDSLVPGLRAFEGTRDAAAYGSWEGLQDAWRATLEALGQSFRHGEATVDPKYPRKTCEHCGLTSLCRVHEREAGILAVADDAGDDGT